MSTVVSVSDRLGEYMLQGWVLTDKPCSTPGCNVPMMRSPNGRIPITHFCVNCDDRPGAPRSKPTISISDSSSSRTSGSHISRSSTPPTDVSSTLSSPVFAPPADTEESRRRREQSDRASSEIGKRLLKGWAMLGDECPNDRCYGVPLVRPPKAGGEKDPRKECVICGNVYLTDVDWAGRERLIPAESDPMHSDTSATASMTTSRGIANGHEEATPISRHGPIVQPAELINAPDGFSRAADPQPLNGSTGRTQKALEESAEALQSTLRTLSTQLVTLSSVSNGRTVEPSSIGSTADAIGKVTQALSCVRQLQWSESQAQQL